jgi:hypothetical protein
MRRALHNVMGESITVVIAKSTSQTVCVSPHKIAYYTKENRIS